MTGCFSLVCRFSCCAERKAGRHRGRPLRCLFGADFLFHPALVSTLATPFPSVRTGDFPEKGQRFAAKILHWRKDSAPPPLAPLLGELSAKLTEGSPVLDYCQ